MPELILITDLPDIEKLFSEIKKDFSDLNITVFNSLYHYLHKPEKDRGESSSNNSNVVFIDTSIFDFKEPHLQNKLVNGAGLNVIVFIIYSNKNESYEIFKKIPFFDIIKTPLEHFELGIRIKSSVRLSHNLSRKVFFETIADNAQIATLLIDGEFEIIWRNKSAEQLSGTDKNNPVENTINILRNKALKNRNNKTISFTNDEGRNFFINCTVNEVEIYGDKRYILMLQDVTEKKQRENELMLSAKVFEHTGESVFITDREDNILQVNRAFTENTGYTFDEVRGKNPAFLNTGKHSDQFYKNMWSVVHSEGHWTGEIWNRRKDGEVVPEWMSITSVKNEVDEIDHYITILSNITERLAEEKNIRYLAQHDFLTGLPNRVLFKDRFELAASNAGRFSGIMGLLFLDLDEFKPINDTHGHYTGDLTLQHVSDVLLSALRSVDSVCRWGGDEFIVLLSSINSVDDVLKVAEKINDALSVPLVIDDIQLCISASIGISIYPEHGFDLDELQQKADRAMYKAKEKGNSFKVYDNTMK